ncbi:MAG: hypothetical protein PHI79_07065 [Sulfurovaceae bacterium]|nr:hypothetical protein [Sulfurovaceae bacterium]MDD5549337.1 hypothetical protein [Sulfurovaceae bacterium]
MKIDDSFSPSIAALAMPKGSNFLTDIGTGISDYYKQKDLDEKNSMLMSKARDEMSDRKSQVDYLNSGKSYVDYLKGGGTAFKTPEAIENTTKFGQNNSLWELRFKKAKNDIGDEETFGKIYTPEPVKKAGYTFTSYTPIVTANTIEDNKEKIGIAKTNSLLDISKFGEDQRHNQVTEQIGVANANTGQQNANTSTTNANLRAVELDYKMKNGKKEKELTPAQILANQKATDALNKLEREKIIDVYKTKAGDVWSENWDNLSPDEQDFAIDYYKKYKGMPPAGTSSSFMGIGGGFSIYPYEQIKGK